jgi:1-acyl-sn-glycerol-3-phosphate acyltransferase
MQPETKTEVAQYIATDHQLQRLSILASQIMIAPLLLALRLLVVRNNLHRDPIGLDLKKNGRKAKYVMYANHQSRLDPLIICASLPLKTVRQLLPFRFFVENSYLKGSLKVFLNMMGGFPAHYESNRAYGLDRARSLMSSNQTIVIFPPGMRTRTRVAKPGISVLATEPDTYLIPIHLNWKHRWHCEIRVGTPIKGGVTRPPEQLMQYVYELQG